MVHRVVSLIFYTLFTNPIPQISGLFQFYEQTSVLFAAGLSVFPKGIFTVTLLKSAKTEMRFPQKAVIMDATR